MGGGLKLSLTPVLACLISSVPEKSPYRFNFFRLKSLRTLTEPEIQVIQYMEYTGGTFPYESYSCSTATLVDSSELHSYILTIKIPPVTNSCVHKISFVVQQAHEMHNKFLLPLIEKCHSEKLNTIQILMVEAIHLVM